MVKRRDFLIMGAMLSVNQRSAWGFRFDTDPSRYREWLAKFKNDIEKTSAEIAKKVIVPNEKQIGISCRKTIVPGSRAALMVSEWLTEAADQRNNRRGAQRNAGLGSIAMLLLENSTPSGYGGLFPEAPESRFPSRIFHVWYMHIGGPHSLQAYFEDKEQFPIYELPINGTLKRKAYPFLLFEDAGKTLRLAGVGAEWIGAADYLYRKQFS